jgi:hypothetical protein
MEMEHESVTHAGGLEHPLGIDAVIGEARGGKSYEDQPNAHDEETGQSEHECRSPIPQGPCVPPRPPDSALSKPGWQAGHTGKMLAEWHRQKRRFQT